MQTTGAGEPSGSLRTVVLPADDASVLAAAAVLRAGEAVAFPTETVYGLGADARDDAAVLRIFDAKARPRFNPLIVHVETLDAAERLGVFDARARRLARAFWPGPLTLVVPRRPDAGLSDLATAGLETVAVRVPAHPVARALLVSVGFPLAAPSANRSGAVSPTRAAHVAESLAGRVRIVLDGGAAEHGLESAIVAVLPGEPPRLLRPGTISRAEIASAAGEDIGEAGTGRVMAPGQLSRHYAPSARLRLDASRAGRGEALVAFGPPPPGQQPFASLSTDGDPREAAARLFAVLRALDEAGIARAAIMPVPGEGIGEAVNDRLRRAAEREEVQ